MLILTFYFLTLFLGTDTSAQTCSYLLVLEDLARDGWNGNQLTITDNGVPVAITDYNFSGAAVSLPYGASSTYRFSAENGTIIRVAYNPKGKYQKENLFLITLASSPLATIVAQGQGRSGNAPIQIAQFVAQCCCAPSQVINVTLTYNDSTPYFASLRFPRVGNSELYRISRAVNGNEFDDFGDYAYVATGLLLYLEPNTNYSFAVAAINQFAVGAYSNPLNITTGTWAFCSIQLWLLAAYGEGWVDGFVNLLINNAVSTHAMSTAIRNLWEIQVPLGVLTISTEFSTPSQYPEEAEYVLFKGDSKLLHAGGGVSIPTSNFFTIDLCSLGLNSTQNETQHHLFSDRVHEIPEAAGPDYELEAMWAERFYLPKPEDIVSLDPSATRGLLASTTCLFDLQMFDWFGDGWNGSSIVVKFAMPGSTTFNTVQSGLKVTTYEYDWYFWATNGGTIQILYSQNSDPAPWDDAWQVVALDSSGRTVFPAIIQSPPGLAQNVIPSSGSFVVSCGTTPAGCTGQENCASLNRQPCPTGSTVSTCGPCTLGYVAPNGTTNSDALSTCAANNLCATNPCSINAVCTNLVGTYRCTCNSGFSGNGITCTTTSKCTGNEGCPAKNRQVCQASFLQSICGPCNSGFAATDGTTSTVGSSTCLATNLCATNNCSVNAFCTNSLGSYTCTCNSGYTGNGRTCTLINKCTGNEGCPAKNRTVCQASFGSSICGPCNTGYSATDGTTSTTGMSTCADINECNATPRPCSTNALCTNTVGSFSCACNAGYTGNGVNCTASNSGPCPSIRLRRGFFEVDATTRDTYLRAVAQLYGTSTGPYFVNKHASVVSYAHGSPPFLAWHRAFLNEFENALRALDPQFACLTLLYWDWTNTTAAQSLFTDTRPNGLWAGVGLKNGNYITTGPYAFVPSGSSYAWRSVWTTPTQPSAVTMASVIGSLTTYAQIRPTVESYHNDLHNWVGGTMSVIGTSPGDPVFWLHHAFVDQLWASWQDCSGQSLLNAATLTPAIGWENVPSNVPGLAFTAAMEGYTISAQTSSFLVATYGVRYSSTWFQSAFGLNSQICSNRQFVFLQALNSEAAASDPGHHLFGSRGPLPSQGIVPSFRSHHVPSDAEVAWYQKLYETWKDGFLATNESSTALADAVKLECFQNPINMNGATLMSVDPAMMKMEEECAKGFCTSPCWKLTFGHRGSNTVGMSSQSNSGGTTGPPRSGRH